MWDKFLYMYLLSRYLHALTPPPNLPFLNNACSFVTLRAQFATKSFVLCQAHQEIKISVELCSCYCLLYMDFLTFMTEWTLYLLSLKKKIISKVVVILKHLENTHTFGFLSFYISLKLCGLHVIDSIVS